MDIAEQFNLALEFMLLGMGVVFAFLTFLIFSVKWMGDIIRRIESSRSVVPAQKIQVSGNQADTHDDTITAVISAAVHQYQTQYSEKG